MIYVEIVVYRLGTFHESNAFHTNCVCQVCAFLCMFQLQEPLYNEIWYCEFFGTY